MFFPKVSVKEDPCRRWHRPDRHFFANGACQVLAFAFLERYPDLGFHARWIKPTAGFAGNHIYVTNGATAFDYHGLTAEQRLLAVCFKRARRFFPGWDATLVDLPTDVLTSEVRSRQIERLWLRQPDQFLHDALPRAQAFLRPVRRYQATAYRVSFLYFTRCGMMLSWPSRRILSFS